MKNIYLIRHGETEYNAKGIIQGGGLDSNLTNQGEQQAILLMERLKRENFVCDKIYSSPVGRAKRTAEICTSYLNQPIKLDELLLEIGCGEYEGIEIASIPKDKLERLRISEFEKYPGGECVDDVRKRGEKFIEKYFQDKDETILIVSHGNYIRSFACALLGVPSSFALKVFMDNTGFSYFSKVNEIYRMIFWNDTSHLHSIKKL